MLITAKRRDACFILMLIIGFIIHPYFTFCQPTSFTVDHLIGETKISIVENCYKACGNKILFINVHDNEQTSRKAADSFLQLHGGLLIHIMNDSARNIDFALQNKCYTFDPNRIYSRSGRLSSLLLLSDNKDSSGEKEVGIFAKAILNNYIDNRPLVVALHNNSDSNFSITSYVHSQDSIPNSGKVFVNPLMDEDDFILTNDLSIFQNIQLKNMNAVYENVKIIKDDGSLSVYTSLHHIPYINIEAEHGHLQQQFDMLQSLADIISNYEKKQRIKTIHKRSR